MLRDEVVTLLGYRLGSRTDLNDRIIAEMAYVQTFNLEGTGAFLPWFLETEIATITTIADEERTVLPDDFLAEVEDQALWLYDEDSAAPWTELRKNDYDYLRVKYPVAGLPKQYALIGDYFALFPVPDDSYTIKMRYYAKDESLASENIENKWLKHAADLVLAETGAVMAQHLMNFDLVAKFQQDAAIARQRLYTKHEARRHSNRTYSMGED
jgi:hypothetical protein